MKIVTIGDKNYREFLDENINQFKKFGYDYIVYNLGGLGYGKKFKARQRDFDIDERYGIKRISCKPDIIRKEIEKNDLLIYLDGDTLLNTRIDGVFDDDYDIGLTIRDKVELDKLWDRDDYMNPVNSGVIFLKRNDRTIKFLDKWIDTCSKMNGVEQASLNYLIYNQCRNKKEGDIVDIDGVKLKLFSGLIYNNYYFDEWLDPAIYHFKGILKINSMARTNKLIEKKIKDNKIDRAIRYLHTNGMFKKNKKYKRHELFLDYNGKKIYEN